MSDGFDLVTLGAPWGGDPLPDGVSIGWHHPHTLLVGSSADDPELREALGGALTLGLGRQGPLVVLVLQAGAELVLEAPRPYIHRDAEPEVAYGDGEHVLWQLIGVYAGVVGTLRAFTTGPEFTRTLRRLLAEQRAHGPLSYEQSDRLIDQWQREAPTPEAVLSRCLVTCRAGG